MKEQCKNPIVFDEKKPVIYFCKLRKGHKSKLHRGTWTKMSKTGRVLKFRDLFWND